MRQIFTNGQVLLAPQLQQLQDEASIVVATTTERDALPSTVKTCWLGGLLYVRNAGGSWIAVQTEPPMQQGRPNAQVSHTLQFTRIPVVTPEAGTGTGITLSGGNMVVANAGTYVITAGYKWASSSAGTLHGTFKLTYGTKQTEAYCGGVNVGGDNAQSMANVSIVARLAASDTISTWLYPASISTHWNTGMDLTNSRLTVARIA